MEESGKIMIPKPFKKTQKVAIIEDGKVNYYFKLTFLNNETAVFDNSGNQVMSSKIINNKQEANNVITYPGTKK